MKTYLSNRLKFVPFSEEPHNLSIFRQIIMSILLLAFLAYATWFCSTVPINNGTDGETSFLWSLIAISSVLHAVLLSG